MWRYACVLRFRHLWTYHQHNVTTDDGACLTIAFKLCERCAKSKLIHILK